MSGSELGAEDLGLNGGDIMELISDNRSCYLPLTCRSCILLMDLMELTFATVTYGISDFGIK